MATKTRVYLAAPFFSPEESRIVTAVENVFNEAAVAERFTLFSPRSEFGACDVRIKEERTRCFNSNIAGLNRCGLVIAWMERIPEHGARLALLRGDNVVADNVRLPDLGTVWETGFAYSSGIPVYLFSRSRETRLNVMLSECADGIIYGVERLKYLLANVRLRDWKGEVFAMNREDERTLKGVQQFDESPQS